MNSNFDNAEFTTAISKARAGLDRFVETSGAEIQLASQALRRLACQANDVIGRVASIVDGVNAEALVPVLSQLEEHCLRTRSVQESRLDAAASMLETIPAEIRVLDHVMGIAFRQESIASHLKALSMLTNIEAIRIGGSEGEFRLLAQELSSFATFLLKQTIELSASTERHKHLTDEILAAVSSELPRFKAEAQQMESDLTDAVKSIEAGLKQLSRIPQQFNQGARHAAEQISGVIAAVQGHDITRQQIEHVQRSLEIVLSSERAADPATSIRWPVAHAGLNIQTAQLKMIKGAVAAWVAQIGNCLNEIHSLSAEELVEVPIALHKQWSDLSAQLIRLETLQLKTEQYGATIHRSLAGFANLKELAQRQMHKSKMICDRLRLLTLNSLIEAHALGSRGAGVSAIAKLIQELAEDWAGVTEDFQGALAEITAIYHGVRGAMDAFSDAESGRITDDQAHIRAALEQVNRMSRFVAGVAGEMQRVTTQMRSEVIAFEGTKKRLSNALGHLDTAEAQVESVICRLEKSYPTIASDYNFGAVEGLFGGFYTTESEVEVMKAVLLGSTSPVPTQSLAGNSVELF